MSKLQTRDIDLSGSARIVKNGSVIIDESGNIDAPITPTLSSGKIYVGNSSNVAAQVTPSGDVTITNTGVTAIGSNKITPAMLTDAGALTATADGLTTGAMIAERNTYVVTSAAATNAVTLPGLNSTRLLKPILLYVGANGCELLTPASSNVSINGTDADGTNQADIPANSLVRLTPVSETNWIMEIIGSTGTVSAAVIPDND